MEIIEQLNWRYATKKFNKNKQLSAQDIQQLKEAFNLTATSYGLQPIKLVILSNKTLQKELVAHTFNQPQVEQASHVLVFCIETKIDTNYIETYFKRIKAIRNTPDAITNPFKQFLIEDFDKKSQVDIESWAVKQVYLAMGNLLTVCALHKIDACPMEGFVGDKYDEVLDLKSKNLKSILIMPIGFRAEDDMFADFKKVRKPLSDAVIEL
ncbi:NAD(P)H-dependent oxidoreductase [Bizionia gelidisalsuginis]|uniref:NAD(P)H-dependent oxidoreductase n=1 Tax=Bizionia gelidisalsuginis TaxID=291188 RepID=A0ABY3MBW7_9FLAO|nr:NAD(P)H-dependent oxidoreductase [Bizionia gelidisalsuginis]TYC14808.1 NAD(P)H-dependent oxidoreductase [Bizionia gelidisalsuginis]